MHDGSFAGGAAFLELLLVIEMLCVSPFVLAWAQSAHMSQQRRWFHSPCFVAVAEESPLAIKPHSAPPCSGVTASRSGEHMHETASKSFLDGEILSICSMEALSTWPPALASLLALILLFPSLTKLISQSFSTSLYVVQESNSKRSFHTCVSPSQGSSQSISRCLRCGRTVQHPPG